MPEAYRYRTQEQVNKANSLRVSFHGDEKQFGEFCRSQRLIEYKIDEFLLGKTMLKTKQKKSKSKILEKNELAKLGFNT